MATRARTIIGHPLSKRVVVVCEHCRSEQRWPSVEVCRTTPHHRHLPARPRVFFCSSHCQEMYEAVGVLMACQRDGCVVRYGSKQAVERGGGPFYCSPACADMDAPRRASMEREMAQLWREAQPVSRRALLRIA